MQDEYLQLAEEGGGGAEAAARAACMRMRGARAAANTPNYLR